MPAESLYDQQFAYNRSNRIWSPTVSVLATPTAASDQGWKIVGTNAVDGDAPVGANGGITLTTHGGASDSTILAGIATVSVWGVATCWYAQNYPCLRWTIKTPASLTNTTLWGGLKLTNTSTVATDNDQAFFRFAVATSANWVFNISRAGVDESVTSSVPVVASTMYTFDIQTLPTGQVQAYINGNAVQNAPFTAMASSTALLPFFGVLSATDATAKTCSIYAINGSTVI